MSDKLIADLLQLPERVRTGDFVLKLAEGVTEPEKTLEQYVVTPQLVECFQDALGFIRQAVETVSSKACYLHGSFGAGKSHFMAVLHLLLQHNPAVRNHPELAPVVGSHAWVEHQKLLLVPFHCLNSKDVETTVLGGYVDYVRQQHPDAPVPAVFLAEGIFHNAAQLRADLGDEKFFARLNRGTGPASKGWGKVQEGWTSEKYAAAVQAPPGAENRLRLVSDIVDQILPAFVGVANKKDEAYVDLDLGLEVISQHAKQLGYDGLILFLDELILWLSNHIANLPFVTREANKLVKLVESRKTERPIPIISFVARQRDLREIVGDNVPGIENLNFSQILSHFEGRFHTITLEDRNLPLIAQKRVLRARNGACRAEIDEAFDKTAQVRAEILEVLLTRESDRNIFKMVYPFSPALIQALVAVSSALQRERTALKLMLEILIKRRDTLRLGDVIPLGDLWDVVAAGDEAFSDVMRVNFENARKLYQLKLRPMLERQHEVDLEVDRPRAQTDSAVAEKLQRFDNDDRLVKSLLLSALVHGVEALRNMTCVRLAALNHGTIRSRIPGREHQVVVQKLRTWAGIVGEIRVGDEPTNPTVSLQLSGVDTETIIESARSYDNISTRQFRIRQLLFQSMNIADRDELYLSHEIPWRGTKRVCDLLFTNVRTLPDESLRSSEDWKLVIDFPFDTDGHSPVEDLDRVEKFREKKEPQRTIVWLPSFFSTRTQQELAKLVIIERLLLGNNLEQHAKHLSLQDRETARLLLKNQQSALAQRLVQAVEAAYAIRSEPSPGTLDASYDMSESHFQSLYPTLVLQRPVGANLGEAVAHLLDQALSHQFPRHPRFGQEVKPGKDLRQVLEVCQEAARTPDRRVFVEDKNLRVRLRNICNPLELGNMSETHFVLENLWKEHFNRMLAQSGQPHPTVADLRKWIDQPEERGLPREIQHLLILVYAEQTNRTFVLRGGGFEPTLDDLPRELELQEQSLPDLNDWNTTVTRVADILGHPISKLMNAANLATLSTRVKESLETYRTDCQALPDQVQKVLNNLGVAEAEFAACDRVRTARAVKSLLAGCENRDSTALVGVIAQAKIETTATAMGKSLKSARDILECLRTTRWDLFAAMRQIQDERQPDAGQLIKDVVGWLKTDEHALAGGLANKLSEAEGRAIQLLTPPKVAPPPRVSVTPPLLDPAVEPTPEVTTSGDSTGDVPKPTSTTVPTAGGTPGDAAPSQKGWKQVQTKTRERLGHHESIAETESILQQLKQNSRLRLTIQWTLEEESP